MRNIVDKSPPTHRSEIAVLGKGFVVLFKKLHLELWLQIIIVIAIAWYTGYNTHSDEHVQLDAFRYYETHWWPPEIGSSDVLYSAFGYSRVFTGEIGFLIYGKAAWLVQTVIPLPQQSYKELLLPTVTEYVNVSPDSPYPPDYAYYDRILAFLDAHPVGPAYRLYRFFNVALLLVTIVVLLRTKLRNFNLTILALGFLTLPNSYYLYSYATTHAIGVSLTLFLFIFVLKILEADLETVPWWKFVLLGLLAGLLMQMRKNHMAGLVFPFLLLIVEYLYALRNKRLRFSTASKQAGVTILVTFLVIAPLLVVYPLTQGNYSEKIMQAAETYAWIGLKPSQPLMPDVYLYKQGVTFFDLLTQYGWLQQTLRNFYASYNYDTKNTSAYIYTAAWILWAFLLLLTFVLTRKNWDKYSFTRKAMYLLSPLAILINLSASLARSLLEDYTPLGRYLMPSIVPFSILLFGSLDEIPPRLQKLHQVVIGLLYVLCILGLAIVES